jgi:hypothetical protein
LVNFLVFRIEKGVNAKIGLKGGNSQRPDINFLGILLVFLVKKHFGREVKRRANKGIIFGSF